MNNVSRGMFDALLPNGSAWNVVEGGELDKVFDSFSENDERIRVALNLLSDVRSGLRTPILGDTELEYGILPDTSLSESIRRQRLHAIQTAADNDGTRDFLQGILDANGFNVTIHENDPAVNLLPFLENAVRAICGNDKAVCGNSSAVAADLEPLPVLQTEITICGNSNAICGGNGVLAGGSASTELLANGDLYYHPIVYQTLASGNDSICGNLNAMCGVISGIQEIPVEYNPASIEGREHLVFVVAGEGTRDQEGRLIALQAASVPIARREEFRALIVKYKPMHTWAAVFVNYD